MDRKHLFKHKTASAKNARETRRHERQEAQRKQRDATLIAKRMRKNTVSGEEDYTPEQVQSLIIVNMLTQIKGLDSKSIEKKVQIQTVFSVKIIEATRKLVSNTDPKDESFAASLKLIRRALSMGTALMDAFLSVEGSLKCLVRLVADSSVPGLMVEAAWCLNNLSAGTDSEAAAVIEAAGEALVNGLKSGNVPLEDQCAWAVGNLAGGNAECRQKLRSLGAIEPLIDLLKSSTSSVVHCAAFALSNLARDKETTNQLTEAGIIPHLASHLIYEKGRLDVLAEVGWVFTYLTACGTHEAEIVQAGIHEKIISLVLEIVEKDIENVLILTPLLRCLGNIICSGPEFTGSEACERKELFPALDRLLHSDHQHIRKECLWVLSNITVLGAACQQLFDTSLSTSIISLLAATYDVKKEAAYTLCNIAAHGASMCAQLVEGGALQAMIPLLKTKDHDTVHYALSFCEMILEHTENGVKLFQEHGGLEGLEGLEYNDNDVLRAQADTILEVYFYKEDKEIGKDVEKEENPGTVPANQEEAV